MPRARILEAALATLEDRLDVPRARLRRLLAEWRLHDWRSDPFARGAYSYIGVGGIRAPQQLARPVKKTLFFAGEATEPEESGTVQGAIASGRRAAREVIKG